MNNQRVRFGIAPINWSNDDMPEIGGHYTLDTILSEMSEAGYSGTEIGNKFPKNASSIKKELNKYSLELASSWHSTFFLTKNTEAELSNVEQSCTVLNEVGAKTINIAECSKSIHGEIKTPLKEKPICDKKDWKSGLILGPTAHSIRELAKVVNLHCITIPVGHPCLIFPAHDDSRRSSSDNDIAWSESYVLTDIANDLCHRKNHV